MELTDFANLISEEVSKKLDDCFRVRINTVRKNNNIVLTGLTIMRDESNLSPTIYLNNYFQEYTNGRTTLESVVNAVMDTYNKNQISNCLDMQYFLHYEQVKQSIVYKLINTEKNKELLEDVPHMEFLDLSIVFQCVVSQEELGLASILIHNTHLKMWDVTVDILYQAAMGNTPKLLPYELKSMAEVLCDIMQAENPDKFDYDECMTDFSDSIPMFVLSNKARVEGAGCMLYPDVLHDFAETINSNFYIIPSSVHELLLLPSKNDEEYAEIKSMIKEINNTQVSAEEILSYSLYYFDRENDKIVSL